MDIKVIRKNRLRQLIDLKYGGVMARLAETIGRQSSYVARILSDNPEHSRNIGEKLARQIEEACDLPYRYLDAPPEAEFLPNGNGWTVPGSASNAQMANDESSGDPSLLIPKMDVSLEIDQLEERPNFDRMVSSIGLHKEWIRIHLPITDPTNLRVITASGNSMEPVIYHGDLLLIDVGVREFTYDGVYLISFAGQRMIKRVQRVLDGLRVLSDNRVYPEMTVSPERYGEIEIHGRAVYTWMGANL